jgi:membrane-bound metal-dependent hydrolase YbcI (DUF457 family)
MYPGHFAAGLALKVAEPRTPTFALMIGVGLLDLIYGVLVAFHIEGGGFEHFITPWSHSLLMALVWSALFAACYRRSGTRVAVVLFASVMSHWILDVFSHHPDMSLWPYSRMEFGFRDVFGGLAGWFEALFCLVACGLYAWNARLAPDHGRSWGVACVIVLLLYAVEYLVVP